MAHVNSFSPVAGESATCLILGSMPGRASLDAHQYYAHERNAFWPIMSTLLGFSLELPYADRCNELLRHGVALWDVLRACERPGSLDSAIIVPSMVANDFAGFYHQHRHIRQVYFNGATAEKVYGKHVKPLLTSAFATIPTARLPSTSPAHAAMSYQEKLARWRVLAALGA